jgi:uncharacterized protein YueI
MSFSRSTILRTPTRARNPLQQYYNTTARGVRNEIPAQVQISPIDNLAGAYKVNYSVGGFSDDANALPLTTQNIIKWVYSSEQDDFTPEPDFLVNNPYINPRPDGSRFNIASVLEGQRKQWLLSLSENRDFLTSLVQFTRDGEAWLAYENAVAQFADAGALRISRLYVENNGWNADGDQPTQLRELFKGMYHALTTNDLDANRYLEPVREKAIISLTKIAYGLLSDEEKMQLASTSGTTNKYHWTDASFAIPYVLNRNTSEYYSLAGAPDGKFHINPEYHYYLDCYEERISGSAIHETMLPNIYVHGLTLNGIPAGLEFGPDARISSDWDGAAANGVNLQSAYDYHTTLGGRTLLPDLQMSYDSMSQYLQQVGNILSAGEIPPQQQRKIAGLTDSIVIPGPEYEMYNSISYNDFAFPMKIDVEIPTGKTGRLGELLEEKNLTSILARGLQHFQKHGRDRNPSYEVDYHLESQYLKTVVPDMENIRANRRPLLEPYKFKSLSQEMTTYDLVNIFLALAATDPDLSGLGETDRSLLFSAFGKEMAGNPLSEPQETIMGLCYMEMIAFAEGRMENTTPIFNLGKPTYSEPLIYKLEKRDADNNIIQELFFSNKKDLGTVIYTDTQIKYDREYDYQVVEYRIMTGIEEFFTLVDFRVPNWVDNLPLNPAMVLPFTPPLPPGNPITDPEGDQDRSVALSAHAANPEPFTYEFLVQRKPTVRLVEHRIVGPSVTGGSRTKHFRARGVSFPAAKVMDRPPVAPDLLILPIKDNFTQVKTLVDPGTGKYLKEQALPIVSIGNRTGEIRELANYQEEFEYYNLLPNHLEFADEGIAEIKEFTLYWTTSLNRNVAHYSDIYKSFNPDSNSNARLKKFKTDELIAGDIPYAPGFGALLNLEPNVTYYITCTVEDVHQNVSNPSPIYEARLHYEKGLLVPQIKLFHFVPINNKQISRKMARFIEIKASAIQTQPAIITNDDGAPIGTRRSLASELGSRVTNNDFVIRFTSRDTGKKFDLRVSFDQQDILPEPERLRCGPVAISTPPVAVPRGVINTLIGLVGRTRTWNVDTGWLDQL